MHAMLRAPSHNFHFQVDCVLHETRCASHQYLMPMAGENRRFSACLRCTQTCYRTHGKGNFNGSSFFKVMLGDFSTRLRIPPKFADQIKDCVGPDVILEGPSGQLWHAKSCRMGTGMTIEHGWKSFVSDHAIEFGDFLVFKHAGNSHFIVQIFGRTGCEKQSVFTVTRIGSFYLETENVHRISDQKKQENKTKNTQHSILLHNDLSVSTKEKRKEDATDTLGTDARGIAIEDSAVPHDMMQASSAARDRCERNHRTSSSYNVKLSIPESYVVAAGRTKMLQTGAATNGVDTMKCAESFCNEVDKQDIESLRKGSKLCVSQYTTKRQGSREALMEAMSFKTSKPMFLMAMKKSHLCPGFRLRFPLEFARRWLPKARIELTLLGPNEEQWTATYPGDRITHFVRGWKDFAFYYNLKEGDICIFELVSKKVFTLKVHLFREIDHRASARMKARTVKTKYGNSRSKECTVNIEIGSQEIQGVAKCERVCSTNLPVICNEVNHHADILKHGECSQQVLKQGCQGMKESLDRRRSGMRTSNTLKRCHSLFKDTMDDYLTTTGCVSSENKYSSEIVECGLSVANGTHHLFRKKRKFFNSEEDCTHTQIIDQKPYFLRGASSKSLIGLDATACCKSSLPTAAAVSESRLRCRKYNSCFNVVDIE